MKEDSDVKKTTSDLFLGQLFEGTVQKNMRETGEWLGENTETVFRSTKTSKSQLVAGFPFFFCLFNKDCSIACVLLCNTRRIAQV
jgi:hypothetical protein